MKKLDIQPIQRRAWAEIDLDAVRHNFCAVKRQVGENVRICCVVKANAYGHGAVQLGKLYESLGAGYFAVSNLEEAIQLRQGGICLPILILGYTDPLCAKELSTYDITQCVFSKEYGESLAKYAENQSVQVKIHVKVDTGMGRIGFRVFDDEIEDIEQICRLKSLNVEGIFTHFSSADEGENGDDYTEEQFKKFIVIIEKLRREGIDFKICHCANSAAVFDYPHMHLDMVRAGVVLYGLQPSTSIRNSEILKPVMKLKTVIDYIKDVEKGCYIGYGRDFFVERNMRIATIPIGYADGLWRMNYKRDMVVEVGGQNAKIVGRICMDQCMIDITELENVDIGSEVTVYGEKNCSVDDVAKKNHTINYEVVCAVGERVPRVFFKEGKVVGSDNLITNA